MTKQLHRATIDVIQITKLLSQGLITHEQAADMAGGSVGPATVCGAVFYNGTVTWADSAVTCEDCNEIMILNTLGNLP